MAKKFLFNFPIETPEAVAFWDSEHKCNTAKSYAAFSKDEKDFNNLMKRAGYSYQWRKRCLANFSVYVSTPSMEGIPFSRLDQRYWDCLANAANIDLEWLVTEMTETTIATENCRPLLTENAKLAPAGAEQPLPVQAWFVTEMTETDIYTEDGLQLISENYTTSKNIPTPAAPF